MTMTAKLRSLCTRLIRGVPDDYIRADADAPKYHYAPADDIPDLDRMIEAGLAEPWRTDQEGIEWFKVSDTTIAAVADFDPDDFDSDDFDPDSDLIDDDDDFEDDDFDDDFDDGEVDDYDYV